MELWVSNKASNLQKPQAPTVPKTKGAEKTITKLEEATSAQMRPDSMAEGHDTLGPQNVGPLLVDTCFPTTLRLVCFTSL